MATPGGYHNPVMEAADLKDPEEKLAYEEGHDADLPAHSTTKSETDAEKAMGTAPTEVRDPNEVWWNEPEEQDPQNPMNWPSWKKWGHIAILSYMTLITPLGSSVFAPGVPALLKEFGSASVTLSTFVVSVYLLGFAFGPLIVAPLSELYGRYWVYTISNFLFVIFAVACAVSKNMTQLIVFRFFHGISGVSPLTIGSGTVADIMPIEKRGGAMAIWALGPLIGPVVGPLGGAYLVEAKSWRWTFWLLAILSALASILGLFLLRETYPPVLMERKAARLRKETGNQNLRSRLASDETKKEVFLRAIVRPTKMLFLSPIVFIICFYTAIAYGILYLLFTTFTFVFAEVYHFSTGTIGLTFIPLGLGMILALLIMGTASDRIIKGKQARGETVVPEDRIPLGIVLPAALFLPAGLFIYGWTTQKATHWIAPMIGTCVLGAGLLIIFMALQTYLVDAFVRYAASATAANTVLRSLLGGLLPLCGLKMYDALGLGWGNSLLGFIALALVPVPVIFALHGEKIRKHPRFQLSL